MDLKTKTLEDGAELSFSSYDRYEKTGSPIDRFFRKQDYSLCLIKNGTVMDISDNIFHPKKKYLDEDDYLAMYLGVKSTQEFEMLHGFLRV